MNAEIVNIPVQLANGSYISVQATVLGREEEVSARELFSFTDLTSVIQGLAAEMITVFEKVAPSKSSVEFGVEVGIESGKLTALLVKGTATANLKITLEWIKP